MKKELHRGKKFTITNITEHFMERMEQRKLKFPDIKETLRNPRCSYKQAGNRILVVGPKISVIISDGGSLITAYENRKRKKN